MHTYVYVQTHEAYFLQSIKASAVINCISLLDIYSTNHCTITAITTLDSCITSFNEEYL